MWDNLKNLPDLMGQAKELKGRMEQLQDDLTRQTVEADAGAGAVRVTVNGKLEVSSVRFDQLLLISLAGEGSDMDQQMVEDLTAAAINAALHKARELAQQEMGKLTGGLNIPGLEKLIGG